MKYTNELSKSITSLRTFIIITMVSSFLTASSILLFILTHTTLWASLSIILSVFSFIALFITVQSVYDIFKLFYDEIKFDVSTMRNFDIAVTKHISDIRNTLYMGTEKDTINKDIILDIFDSIKEHRPDVVEGGEL